MRRFSPEEDAAIVAQWSVGPLCDLAAPLARRPGCIHARALALVKRGLLNPAQRFYQRPWTEADTDAFLDGLGEMPLPQLARKLRRSVTALQVRKRRMGVTQRDNWLPAREVARLLGVDSKRVAWLIERGLLAGEKSWMRCGKEHMWRIEVKDFERFIRRHPAWYNRRRITEEPWLSMARAVWRADPLLTLPEAAAQRGVAAGTLAAHCQRGWLRAEKVENSGNHGTWIVRQSDLDAWQPRRPELVGVSGPTWRSSNSRCCRRMS